MYYYIILFAWISICLHTMAQNKTGCISGNCKDGKGTYVFQDGAVYVGEFVNGIMEGFGKLTDKYGNVYTGQFKNNKYEGIGKFERTDGTKYIGEFKNGRRHGLGTQYYSASYKEKGKWENDRFMEEASFQDFIVEEPYSFCQALMSILHSAGSNFEGVKGEQINKLIPDEYYCTVPIKELSTVSIHSKNGYSGTYFKGNYAEALQKAEELHKMVKSCFETGCYTTQLTNQQTAQEKTYEYLILSSSKNCQQTTVGTKIIVKAKSEKNAGTVLLEIIPRP
ncbi:MAG: hypothetical protein N2449_01350 [Bacteroidales bacterium]|nr:hypothetical protein [Bacteroidales bacterium]